ncbi:SRB8 (YCR081W) [Zygosaccharomyces parabailii]|nr:SRB8 (YCR081W) [Zygosaccharomyces parabailii]
MTPSKYILTPPDDLHPYVPKPESHQKEVYPDFDPWRHTKEEDEILLNYVSKGYYSTSKVNFESISARSSLQESLPKLSDQLADQFSQVLHIREGQVNKILSGRSDSNGPFFNDLCGPGFALPSRITLTEHRRELWLQELSSPYASLHKLSKHIPHGLKRRQVLEQCYIKRIPLKRAIWLIKCCNSIEWKALIAKQQQKREDKIDVNALLLKEWTDNFVYIMEKLIFEMTQHYNDPAQLKRWRGEVGYFLKLLGNCYKMGLLDRDIFHHWLIEFGAKVENFEFLPLTLHIIMIFWDGICQKAQGSSLSQPSFLVSKTAEMLLNKYYTISHSKSMIDDDKYIINDIKKNNKIKESILSTLQMLICKLFQDQSLEAFIFPNSSWDLYKPILYEVTNKLQYTSDKGLKCRKKLELISYRNESLRFNSSLRDRVDESDTGGKVIASGTGINSDLNISRLATVDTKFTQVLDDNPLGFDWSSYVDRSMHHVEQIRQLCLWAIHPSKKSHYEASQLAAKLLLLKINSTDGFQEYVIEDVIWSLVFQVAKLTEHERCFLVDLELLYSLLNVLITYGILKVSTYVRKLISSGILYLPESNDKLIHCELLINLKISPLMKSQYNMVLRNVMEYDTSYYQKYNFDQLLRQSEELKQSINQEDVLMIKSYPLSMKIMTAEWYLTKLCSEKLLPVNRSILMKNYQIFCVDLKAFHHYYKWVEFVVYHQLLSDIESLEALMDILLCYGKLFSQLINDHILFTKTFIFIYTRILREKDGGSYAVTSFMPFWKFFVKSFPYALNADEELRSELSAIYEEEKAKPERLGKNKQEALQVYNLLKEPGPKSASLNFAEVFSTSLRSFLSLKGSDNDQKKFRNNLLLLMSSNSRDYNKFMSIYLKRKDFELTTLKYLISYKLLTFDIVHNILGTPFILNLLNERDPPQSIYFELYRDQYVKNNYSGLLIGCLNNSSQSYDLLLELLVRYGTLSSLSSEANKTIVKLFRESQVKSFEILNDILNYGNTKKDPICDISIENPAYPYRMLNFTNLWAFQSFTNYVIEGIMNKDDTSNSYLHEFLFEMVNNTNYNCLCAHLFDRIEATPIIEQVAQVFEEDFFHRCFSKNHVNKNYMAVVVEVLTSLSQKKHKDSSNDLNISEGNLELFHQTMNLFCQMSETEIEGMEMQLDIFLKIFSIHQNVLFHYIVTSIQSEGLQRTNGLINDMYALFDKISFNLRLKLMLYEILSSLKSYCIFVSTTGSDNGSRFEVPEQLLKLPPFQISSFMKDEDDSASAEEKIELGISTVNTKIKDNTDKWFIFNKRENQYWCKLHNEPYHFINNFQSGAASSFNNSCLNLSLFNAIFRRQNPK